MVARRIPVPKAAGSIPVILRHYMFFVFESPTGLLFLPYFPMSFPVSPFPPFCPRNERKTGQETQPNTRDSRDAHSGSARNARQWKRNARRLAWQVRMTGGAW